MRNTITGRLDSLVRKSVRVYHINFQTQFLFLKCYNNKFLPLFGVIK